MPLYEDAVTGFQLQILLYCLAVTGGCQCCCDTAVLVEEIRFGRYGIAAASALALCLQTSVQKPLCRPFQLIRFVRQEEIPGAAAAVYHGDDVGVFRSIQCMAGPFCGLSQHGFRTQAFLIQPVKEAVCFFRNLCETRPSGACILLTGVSLQVVALGLGHGQCQYPGFFRILPVQEREVPEGHAAVCAGIVCIADVRPFFQVSDTCSQEENRNRQKSRCRKDKRFYRAWACGEQNPQECRRRKIDQKHHVGTFRQEKLDGQGHQGCRTCCQNKPVPPPAQGGEKDQSGQHPSCQNQKYQKHCTAVFCEHRVHHREVLLTVAQHLVQEGARAVAVDRRAECSCRCFRQRKNPFCRQQQGSRHTVFNFPEAVFL